MLFTAVICLSVSADTGEVSSPDLSRIGNAAVYNLENDKLLFSKSGNERTAPASTAKIMTGIIALEHYRGREGESVVVTKEALNNFKGRNINLKADETVSVENLLYAVICGGANDAANVLAYNIAGSHQAFLDMMNAKAKELGMANTYYTNPNGYYDSSMYTTAEDTVLLAKYAYNMREYMEICTTERYVMPETNVSKTRYIFNSNYLIATNVENKYKNKDMQGMNAGSVTEVGYVLVTVAAQDGETNVIVLMGGQSDEEHIYTYEAVNPLAEWAFDSFEYKKILDSGEMICEIDVSLSANADYVVLSPKTSVEYFLPVSVDVEKDVKRRVELYDEKLEAPVEAEYAAGKIILEYEGETIAEVDLITKNNVDRNGFLYVLERIKQFTRSDKFKIVLLCAAAVVLLYVAVIIYRKTRSNRYRYRYDRYKRR